MIKSWVYSSNYSCCSQTYYPFYLTGVRRWWLKFKTSGKYKQKPKQNLSESDSENEITELPRFIAIESLEETPLVKLSFLN